ncbi:hypothetical protein [Streptomyces sp. NPDC005890]|uniref:hypothetical protein n=1 Tax=Streptomyces sp. NPDC005890 TaxID=3154568 RepID=UPI0033D03EEA
MTDQPQLRVPTFSEAIAIETYREIVKQEFSSITTSSAHLLTATLTLTTAYTALLVFASPTGHIETTHAALPYIPFAAAAITCIWSLAKRGVAPNQQVAIGQISSTLSSARKWKRGLMVAAFLFLVIALVLAGIVTANGYAATRVSDSDKSATLILSPAGIDSASKLCRGLANPVHGSVNESIGASDQIAIRVTDETGKAPCPQSNQWLVLRRSDVQVLQISE